MICCFQRFSRINEQDADVVLIAGDLVTSSFGAMKDPDRYAEIFRNIRTRLGTYAVYGNHDVDEPLLGGFTYYDKEDAKRNPNMAGYYGPPIRVGTISEIVVIDLI